MSEYRHYYRALRADWLKLRGYLFDTGTRLPSLPAVVDEVRRRLEDDETLGLIYVDPSCGGHLEPSCGWQAYDQLIERLAESLRDFHRRRLDPRDTLALSGVRGDEFLLFVGLDGGDFETELEELRRSLVKEVRAALRQDAEELPPALRLESASIPLVFEPEIRIERTIYQGLQRTRQLCQRENERRRSRRSEELRRILAQGEVVIRYQPIVELESGRVHGFEALSSAPSRRFFETPELLFAFAERSEVIVELERLCRRQAARRARPLLRSRGAGHKLFVNCSAPAFADPELARDLTRGAADAGLDPAEIVVEVTERVAITEWRSFRRALGELRRAGLRIAIDDMGSGYSSLHAVAEIEPDYLKFDHSLTHGIHLSSIKRDLVETLVLLARKIGARAVAEGIETAEELEAMRAMGVGYGQGFFLAPPALPEELAIGQGALRTGS